MRTPDDHESPTSGAGPAQTEAGRLQPMIDSQVLSRVEQTLEATDELLRTHYPGERDVRQAVHTVYVPAHSWAEGSLGQWSRSALAIVEEHGGMRQLAEQVIAALQHETLGAAADRSADEIAEEAEALAAAVEHKLSTEPIEDLRLDFEDGFGELPDADEDHWAVEAARRIAGALERGDAPPFFGVRFKSLEAPVRRRGLRTLDLFLGHLLEAVGTVPDGLVLTLPKVSTADQVRAMVSVAEALEHGYGLAEGTIGFEVQVETPQLVLGPDGRSVVAESVHAGDGRITSLHYGTYDYSASLGIAAAYQAMDHPAADFAKNQMLLAVAGTGVHISDGSTNILPVGDPKQVRAAWLLHARLVNRHLERGIYQGWDMHPHQLPTRFLATFHFYRQGFASAAARLRAYVYREQGGVLDEPATAKALAGYLRRGLTCGALSDDEVRAATGLEASNLDSLARTGATQLQTP